MSDDRDLPVPMAVFDGAAVSPAERFARFSALTPGYDTLLPPGAPVAAFEIATRGWLLDDLTVSATTCSGIEFRRTPRHIQDYARDTYTLSVLQRGAWHADVDFGRIAFGAGEVVIMDFTVPWHVYGAAQSNVLMVVPRTLLDAAVPDAPRLHGQALTGSSGRLFAEHLFSLARHLPNLKQRDVPLIRAATLSLLGNAVAALPRTTLPPASPVRARTTERIRAFIEANLTDPGLDADRLCAALAITRSTLYRTLGATGGVAAYIQRRRLEAAHARIADADVAATIAEIADTYCFSSPAHFSTAFRRQFGFTPRDARAAPGQADTAHLFRTWRGIAAGATVQ